jgi:hypothetical protein
MSGDTGPFEIAARLLGHEPTALSPIRGGGNNRIFKVETPEGPLALKLYSADRRNRLAAEFGALTMLAEHGIHETPKALAVDHIAQAALYEWIDGTPVTELASPDLDAIFAFLGRLLDLGEAGMAAGMAPASAACLCPADAYEQLLTRMDALAPHARRHALLDRFASVLAKNCLRMIEKSKAMLAQCGLDPMAPLSPERRVLSPSDMGRHNMLRRANGTLVFLDFEYFGWDDPVKAASDFALHPGSAFTDPDKVLILKRAIGLYGAVDPAFAGRLQALFGIFGLIWCLILLNEFLPERWQNRVAAGQSDELGAVQLRQLQKAERLHHWIWEVADVPFFR